jgi:large subunit ribosomal protein L5
MAQVRLKKLYEEKIVPQLKEQLKLNNVMEVPKLEKIVLNVGVKDAVADSKVLNTITEVIGLIAGQKPVRTVAKKSIAGFKLREGMPIGAKVTLRGRNMYEFLDRLINLALPSVRDFQGVSTKLDRRGNYNLGIKEWNIFPEVHHDLTEKMYGLNITFHTSSNDDAHGFELLKAFKMPFKKA